MIVLLEDMRSYLSLNTSDMLYRAVEVSYLQILQWNENLCLSVSSQPLSDGSEH